MRTVLCFLSAVLFNSAFAAVPTIGFNFRDTSVDKVIEVYAKASGQKFIIDPSVKSTITIINPAPITVTEAFNQMSSALALTGIGFSKQNDVMVVMQARSLQRSDIEVGADLPNFAPEKMYTWVVNLKYVSADEINKELRILVSKDGELVPYSQTNQLIVSDWVSNLYRIAKILKEIDIPTPLKPTGQN